MKVLITTSLRNWLIDPRVYSLDPDSSAMTIAHRQVLQSKFMLRQLFQGFYDECRQVDLQFFGNCPGHRLEIGSGSSFIKQVYPDLISSDIKHLPFIDVILSGTEIPFPANSLRTIYGINVFHHIPTPRTFFKECLRVLHPGGGIILIEPYHGLLARWLFKRLHAVEGFDTDMPTWETTDLTGPASGANQALSYIIFNRDRRQFEQEFPTLELLLDKPHTHLLYLVSGGVNFRQLAPDMFTQLVKLAQDILTPLNRQIALQHTIVLRKRT